MSGDRDSVGALKASEKRNLLGLTRSELERLAEQCGEPRYRGVQLYRGLYDGRLRDFGDFTDLSRRFREELAARHDIRYPKIARRVVSRDESVRYLLALDDSSQVEAVAMPWRVDESRQVSTPSARDLPATAGGTEEQRTTLCISSQVGCAVDCKFCFTGTLGVKRNLSAGEIVGQVLALLEDRKPPSSAAADESAVGCADSSVRGDRDGRRRLSRHGNRTPPRLNVVFMGQGEPLLNFRPVMQAVGILADAAGCGLALRRITLSTSGIVPRIRDLAREPVRPKLAVSLNASTQEQREALMPITRKYTLESLMDACRSYPLRPRERLTFEYVMLDGINDSLADARRVAGWLAGIPSRVNLIPYNAGEGLSYRASPFERVLGFQRALGARGVAAFIRISRGQDIMAACGQLSLAEE